MKKISVVIIIFGILFGLGVLVYKFWPRQNKENPTMTTSPINYSILKINNQELKIEVVDNEESRMKGLSGRDSLGVNYGMLFVFAKPDIYPFWMNEMKFSLDIIWLKDKKIVELVKNAQPPSIAGKVENYTPQTTADMVLEVNSGFCDQNGVKTGDKIQIKN